MIFQQTKTLHQCFHIFLTKKENFNILTDYKYIFNPWISVFYTLGIQSSVSSGISIQGVQL